MIGDSRQGSKWHSAFQVRVDDAVEFGFYRVKLNNYLIAREFFLYPFFSVVDKDFP